MQTIDEIGVNLAAALVGFMIGAILRYGYTALKYRRARAYWKPLVKQELYLVVSRFFRDVAFEPSGFMGVGDANALNEARSYLSLMGAEMVSIMYSDMFPGEKLRSNMILLGGPDGNRVSEMVFTHFSPSLVFYNYREHEVTVLDKVTRETYSPIILENGEEHPYRRGALPPNSADFELIRDYGIIIGMQNPYAQDKYVLMIAGCFGYGTWAGARFVSSPTFLREIPGKLGSSFEALVEAELAGGEPQKLTLVVARPLRMSMSKSGTA